VCLSSAVFHVLTVFSLLYSNVLLLSHPMLGMFIPVHYYFAVVPWFIQHRANFTLLVHPNTGCEYEDHSIWAQWSGPLWNMDMSIFTPWTQTESFNQSLGTPHNPSCLSPGGVCAIGDPKADGYGPQVLCCAGTSCDCGAPGQSECYCRPHL
jgi:aromatic ring-cleaving dioxygenase